VVRVLLCRDCVLLCRDCYVPGRPWWDKGWPDRVRARAQVVKTERVEWKGPFVCVAVLKTEKAIVPYVHT